MHRSQLLKFREGSRDELVEVLALGLARYAARPQLDEGRMTRVVPSQKICGIPPTCLEVPPETVLTVTPGLQTESPNSRSTKWKRC